MSLKSTFFAFKKSCTSCPNWEGGMCGGTFDKIQKNNSFFRETVPKASLTHMKRFIPSAPQHVFYFDRLDRSLISTLCNVYCFIFDNCLATITNQSVGS